MIDVNSIIAMVNYAIILFVTCSFIGYIWEQIVCYSHSKKWRKRDYLHLPLKSIYGFIVLVGVLALELIPIKEPWMTFIVGVIVATMIEYAYSTLMGKYFGVSRWDYRKNTWFKTVKKYSYDGKISLPVSIMWGVVGLAAYYFIVPSIGVLADWLFGATYIWSSAAIFVVLIVDYALAFGKLRRKRCNTRPARL